MTSDNFFKKEHDFLLKKGIDVVFIDGLHTYEQSLRDILNSLKFLNQNGVIVLHDCNPPFEAAAVPANSVEEAVSLNIPGWKGQWSGDVWKTILYLRSTRDVLSTFVLDCDWGLGIITKEKSENNLDFTPEDIKVLTYRDLEKNRALFLNLKKESYFKEFLESLR